MLIVGLPAVVIALSSLAGLWRETDPEPTGSPA
jgi:hypothetical protein